MKKPSIKTQIETLNYLMKGFDSGSDFSAERKSLLATIAMLKAAAAGRFVALEKDTAKAIAADAAFLETTPEEVVERSLIIRELMENPTELEGAIDDGYFEGKPEVLQRVRIKAAAAIRAKPLTKDQTAEHREWWARIIECGRLRNDDGSGSGQKSDYLYKHPTLPPYKAAA